jgi:tRNA(Ile)-lysidine synthase
MYHVLVHPLAQLLLSHTRQDELLEAGDRVGVAVSGGIDSIALLRLLIEVRFELGIVVSAVHFNHKLRGAESEADQEFVAGLAREFGLEFYCSHGDVAGLAAAEHRGVEAAARELRYGFFRQLLVGESIATAQAAPHLGLDRSAGSAAPHQSFPQGLKPDSLVNVNGTAEAVPFPISTSANAAPLQSETSSAVLLDKIATGHTLDDQAETVLMRLIRGTGMRGLGGIYPRVVVEDEDGGECGEIIRPLLGVRRGELERYLKDIGQAWREDSSNADAKFTRNRVRHLLLPMLEREFNPAVVENLSELAKIARDEEDYWEGEVSGWMGTVVQWAEEETRELVQIQPAIAPAGAVVETPVEAADGADLYEVPRFVRDDKEFGNISISRPWLLTEPRAVQRRVVKAVGEQAGIPLEFKHVQEALRFAAEDGPAGKELSLPRGWKIVREADAMIFTAPDLRRLERVSDYEYRLNIPGRVFIPELGVVIEALRLAPVAGGAGYNPQQLLRTDLLPQLLSVRNWRAGDRFWPAHTKSAKKVKELLQERHIEQPVRRLWPIVVSGDEIVWMRGFPVPVRLRAAPGQEAVLIREIPLEADDV